MLKLRNNSPVFVIAHLSLTCLIYLACFYCSSIYARYILCLIDIYVWDCLLTLVFNQESNSGTSTLNLEES